MIRWAPTFRLRWEKHCTIDGDKDVLCQQWMSSDDKIEWRPVPSVNVGQQNPNGTSKNYDKAIAKAVKP